MSAFVPSLVIFVLVYVGMILGGLPGLALDRTGVALLGAIAMVAAGGVRLDDVWRAVDMPTLYLLFALMVLSAQFRLAGFYSALVRRLGRRQTTPHALLGLVLLAAGGLSAVLTNDVVCLAMTPVLVEVCGRRNLNPVPFLLGLACASNVGSAATLIGNPQNILIGQTLQLTFGRFLLDAGIPALLGLGATWLILIAQYRGRWTKESGVAIALQAPAFSPWQTAKAIGVTVALIGLFLFETPWPREGIALVFAGVLLLSRRMATREMLSLVDWHLLVLFIGLFVVNRALVASGALELGLATMRHAGVDPSSPAWLFTIAALFSNIVSNVPATMLLLPAATHPFAGPVLALSGTFAGNLILVGSIANIIVATSAKPMGVDIGFGVHARTGVPVTLATLAIAAVWLLIRIA